MAITSRQEMMRAAAVPVAFVLVNVLSYALLLVAAHLMDEGPYGTLSSLLGLLLISTVPLLALQTVAARRCATEAGAGGIIRGTVVVGVGAALLLVLLSPALARFLHLDTVTGILLVAATVPASAVLGTAMGVAQGRRQFPRLAALILATTGGRSACGLIGLLAGRTPNSTLAGIALGTAAAALLVGLRRLADVPGALRDRVRSGVLVETLNAAHAHGTFLLLTGLDVLLARHVLSSREAGVYAVGAVVTRIAVWLPQSVITLMFASLAEPDRHHRTAQRATLVVFAVGGTLVLGCALAGPLAVTVVGGARYHALDTSMWLFALLGALLAVVQLGVLAALARRRARRAAVLWATIVADVVAVLAGGAGATPTRVVATLATVTGVAAAVVLWITLHDRSSRSAEPTPVAVGVLST